MKDWELSFAPAPHARCAESTLTRMRDVLIALAPSLLAGWYFYGARVLLLALAGVLASAAGETLFSLALRRPLTLQDGSFAVTGLLCALLLPAGAGWWVAALSAAVAQLQKTLFGGLGRNPLNPALCGTLLVRLTGLCVMAGPMETLLSGSLPAGGAGILFLGSANGGCIGMCSPLLLLLGYLYLLARELAKPCFALPFLAALALLGALFPGAGGRVLYPLYGLLSGDALLAALYAGADSVTIPQRRRAQAPLGLLGGVLTALSRLLLGLDGALAALLLCNLLSRPSDALLRRVLARRRARGRTGV